MKPGFPPVQGGSKIDVLDQQFAAQLYPNPKSMSTYVCQSDQGDVQFEKNIEARNRNTLSDWAVYSDADGFMNYKS